MPSAREIEAGKTARGGWSRKQLAEWGVPWPPPKGWKKQLIENGRVSPAQGGSSPVSRYLLLRTAGPERVKFVDSGWTEDEWAVIRDSVSRYVSAGS